MDKEYFKRLCETAGGEFHDTTDRFEQGAIFCVIDGITIDYTGVDSMVKAFYSEELPSMPSFRDVEEVITRTNRICRVEMFNNTPGLVCEETIQLTGDLDKDILYLHYLAEDMHFARDRAKYELRYYGV
ncbi:MAG: hypothetical protein GXO43_01610 [Crenarchaeota archaeon]|nr:hypothetical protein [Thermoproteota archaeon]